MFVVLSEVPPKRRGLIKGFLYRRRGFLPEVRRVTVGETHYFLFELERNRGALPLARVRALTGRLDGWVLAPEGMVLPPDSGLMRTDSRAYRTHLLIRAAMAFVERQPGGGVWLSVTLIDVDGRCAELAGQLLRRCGTVCVVTAAGERYCAANDHLGRTIGAELILREDAGCVDQSDCVIAPFGLARVGMVTIHPWLFAADTPEGWDVAREQVPLPAPYAAHLPRGIAPDVFAAALFERCGLAALSEQMPSGLMRGNRRLPLEILFDKEAEQPISQ